MFGLFSKPKPLVAFVETNFIRTCTDTSIVLQQYYLPNVRSVKGRTLTSSDWTYPDVWLACGSFSFFIYAWWNYKKNGDEASFARALNGRLNALIDDIVKQGGGDRERKFDVIRVAYAEMQKERGYLGSTPEWTVTQVMSNFERIMSEIIIPDEAKRNGMSDPHNWAAMADIMSRTFAGLEAAAER